MDALTQGPRALTYTVNGSSPATLNLSGGQLQPAAIHHGARNTKAGNNSIAFGNPGTYAADFDRIVITGDGSAPAPNYTTYEAEAAELSGTASIGGCSFCSAGAYVGSTGDGSQNAVIFRNVTVPQTGIYQLDVEYTTSGPRTVFVTVNDGTPTEIDTNGSAFDAPQPALLTVQLNAGVNKIVPLQPNPGGYAPGLDSIVVGPVTGTSNLQAAITRKAGPDLLRIWQLSLTNSGSAAAQQARVNSVSLSPVLLREAAKQRRSFPCPCLSAT